MSNKKRRTAQNVQNKPAVKQENTVAKEKPEDITDKLHPMQWPAPRVDMQQSTPVTTE